MLVEEKYRRNPDTQRLGQVPQGCSFEEEEPRFGFRSSGKFGGKGGKFGGKGWKFGGKGGFATEDPNKITVRRESEKQYFVKSLRLLGLQPDYDDFTNDLLIQEDAELQRAYRKKSLILHPDKCPNKADANAVAAATARFQEMAGAYDAIVKLINDFRAKKKAATG